MVCRYDAAASTEATGVVENVPSNERGFAAAEPNSGLFTGSVFEVAMSVTE